MRHSLISNYKQNKNRLYALTVVDFIQHFFPDSVLEVAHMLGHINQQSRHVIRAKHSTFTSAWMHALHWENIIQNQRDLFSLSHGLPVHGVLKILKTKKKKKNRKINCQGAMFLEACFKYLKPSRLCKPSTGWCPLLAAAPLWLRWCLRRQPPLLIAL